MQSHGDARGSGVVPFEHERVHLLPDVFVSQVAALFAVLQQQLQEGQAAPGSQHQRFCSFVLQYFITYYVTVSLYLQYNVTIILYLYCTCFPGNI